LGSLPNYSGILPARFAALPSRSVAITARGAGKAAFPRGARERSLNRFSGFHALTHPKPSEEFRTINTARHPKINNNPRSNSTKNNMNNHNMTIPKRESELAAYLGKQPYMTELDGITLKIGKNVFPSDFGLTSSFFGDFMLRQAPAARALDMGCGSGYFAFLLKKLGCDTVLGVDYNRDAVECARENCAFNPSLAPIEFLHSDLFAHVPPSIFDIIVFNFNYYPSDGTFGLNEDGGRKILERFFRQVDNHIHGGTRIYIPYSEFVGEEHDPKYVCPSFGFAAEIMAATENAAGGHCIYKVVKAV
jgi:release factor glutamine methyltransferase